MKRLLIEFLLLAILVSGTWFVLSRFDWVTLFHIEQKTDDLDKKIGDLLWKTLQDADQEITADSVIKPLDSLLLYLCDKNHIDGRQIKLHILENGDVNAFAMPDNHLVVYSGLIKECKNEAEFCGVLGHELAHMEKGHVMNKLVKEMGLSVLISMTTGNGNGEIVRKTLEQVTSTAYDRKLETEADMTAMDYMIEAGLDPEGLANLLYRMADENLPEQIYWISSHPESKERAKHIMEALKNRHYNKKNILDPGVFGRIQDSL